MWARCMELLVARIGAALRTADTGMILGISRVQGAPISCGLTYRIETWTESCVRTAESPTVSGFFESDESVARELFNAKKKTDLIYNRPKNLTITIPSETIPKEALVVTSSKNAPSSKARSP